MKLMPEETSLVIAGAWNAAILNPGWVLQHGLQRPAEANQMVQIFLPASTGLVFEIPRYSLGALSFSVRPDAFVLNPQRTDLANLTLIEDVVARIIDTLQHTPITGVGHNFEFRGANPDARQLDVFTQSRSDLIDAVPPGWRPGAATVASSFGHELSRVQMNIQRHYAGDSIVVKFNFHHPASSVADALSVLRGENGYVRMAANMDLASSLIKTLYGEVENDG